MQSKDINYKSDVTVMVRKGLYAQFAYYSN